jgi:hypothetical protein
MSVVLLVLGILATAAGLLAVGFGMPFNELPVAPTPVLAGTTAICSGLILIGLSAAVSELRRVAEALKGRHGVWAGQPTDLDLPAVAVPPIQAPPTASVRPPAPAGAPTARRVESGGREPRVAEASAASVDVSAAAIERMRSSIPRADRPKAEPPVVAEMEEVPLSPNGSQSAAARASVEPTLEPRVTGADRPGAATGDRVKPSRLDFLFRSRQARPAQQENFDSNWPADGRGARAEPRAAEPRLDGRPLAPPPAPAIPATATAQAAVVAEQRRAEVPPAEPQAPAILKSGVVDGMAYTLYADGSIEAKLPTGTVRFGSIAELRAHIETNA